MLARPLQNAASVIHINPIRQMNTNKNSSDNRLAFNPTTLNTQTLLQARSPPQAIALTLATHSLRRGEECLYATTPSEFRKVRHGRGLLFGFVLPARMRRGRSYRLSWQI